MTEVEVSQPILDPSSEALMDDEAYLMTMVEADALLPSNLAFSSLFDGDNELNPDDLSDIASLLAPEVSDDDTSESVSSETNTPVTLRPSTPIVVSSTAAATEIPILPAVVSPTGSAKRSFILLQDAQAASVPPLKKAKASASPSITLQPKPKPSPVVSAPTTPFPSLAKPNNTPNPLSADESNHPTLPALAPKPPTTTSASSTATTKPLPTLVIKKKADPASIQSAIAPSNKAHVNPKAPTAATAPEAPAEAAPAEAAASDPAASKPVNEEDRAKQCRDRNRQHARNTRLRKKAYVEELKNQLRDLVEQRDAKLLEETQKTKIVEQQREVRFQVMQDFLQLRGRNEGNPHRWGAILEEGFSLTLPKTKFQTMVAPTTTPEASSTQMLHGVSDIMADSTYFATFLQSLPTSTHSHTTHPTGDDTSIPITLAYDCDRSTFLMDESNALMNWTAGSVGAVTSGAIRELELCGTMRAQFCSQTNRLEKAEIQFDTGLVHSQLLF